MTAVIGFYGTGVKKLQKQKTGEIWLKKNINYLLGICLVNQYCWMDLKNKPWSMQKNEQDTNEEVKRFIAVLIDNIRTKSKVRMDKLSQGPAGGHKDFLSQYIRH